MVRPWCWTRGLRGAFERGHCVDLCGLGDVVGSLLPLVCIAARLGFGFVLLCFCRA